MSFDIKPLPTLFISHGAPTFALEPGRAGALLREAGKQLRLEPSAVTAVLIVSPHWTTPGYRVMAAEKPATIHDFGGFDPRLNALRYPASGHPQLAASVAKLLEAHGQRVSLDTQRGYDHGAWVPLVHLLPDAKLPVIQLSMPSHLTPQAAFELGQWLQPLSEQGVVIIGSGSITHNLGELNWDAADGSNKGIAYAHEFVAWVRTKLQQGDSQALIHSASQAPHAARAHPTDEHYLPLLIALGAARKTAQLQVLDGGFTYGVIGMESYIWQP